MKNATLIPDELRPRGDVEDLPALSTKKQVAAWRQVSTRKIEMDCAAGIFVEPIRCGKHPRWRRSDLLAWLESQSSQGSPQKTNCHTAEQFSEDIQRLSELATPLPVIAKTLRLPKRLAGHVLQHGEPPEAGPQCDGTTER